MRSYYDNHAPHTWAAPQARTTRTGAFQRWVNRYDYNTRQYHDRIDITQKNPTSGAFWITDVDGAISVWAEGEWRIIGYQIGTDIPANDDSQQPNAEPEEP